MRLFITFEAQHNIGDDLSEILKDIDKELNFVTNNEGCLESINNYGDEFRELAIIPTCLDDCFWNVTGWRERKQIWRKKREADIRLRMDYEQFANGTYEKKRLLFIDIIIKSIRVVQEKSKGDFKGEKLIKDILNALNVSPEQLKQL